MDTRPQRAPAPEPTNTLSDRETLDPGSEVHFYDPAVGHGLAQDPFKAIVAQPVID